MPHAHFAGVAPDDRPPPTAIVTLRTSVDAGWIDYNGHMTEWQYYKVLADAGDNFLRHVGFTPQYLSAGNSFFSVEGHMRNLRECCLGTPLEVHTNLIGYDAIRLHIYQYVVDTSRDLTVATGEHLMLHVGMQRRKASPMLPALAASLDEAFQTCAPQLQPKGLGVGVRSVPEKESDGSPARNRETH